MEKRVILALGLSLFILIGYQVFMSQYYPQRNIAPVPATTPGAPTPGVDVGQKEESPMTERNPVGTEIQQILPAEEEVVFTNKLYTITFSDVGAAVKKITLNKNPNAGLNVSYDIFNAKNPRDSMLLFFPDKTGANLNNVKYEVKKSDDRIIFIHNFNNEFILEKRFSISNSLYLIGLELSWRNIKGQDISKKYSLISGAHLPSSPMDERFLEISANLDGKILKNKKAGKAFELQKSGILSWLMLKNRYFSIISKSFLQSSGYLVSQSQDGKLVIGINIPAFDIPSNSTISHRYSIYIGPSNFELVKAVNIGVEGALSYGFLGSIGQLLMSVLKFFHIVTKNWGIAIILLALFINIVLFPLTKKSYKSMHEIQILQPKIEKLRQECKNNPQRLQKEIMELYKKYKVNPMGGCLPLILQMPIFFALYQSLINFIELRGAKFLWIKDLSVTEGIKIPFQLPLIGNGLNLLPIFMLIAMFFQQKLSSKVTSISQTDEQRQQQKIMMVMMTVMFGFIFYNMPSGFVLYWLSSTVIMSAIQYWLTQAPKPQEIHA